MRIQPIVEGHGDVSAVPVLLRRLRDEAGAFGLDVNSPIRRKRSEFATEEGVRKAVRLALLQPQTSAILVLFDSDDDCPKELAPRVQGWAQAESRSVRSAVVMAHREYEAWFLAAIESLRGRRGIRNDANSHPQPELPRGTKSQLEDRMEKGHTYAETTDQAALSAVFDMRTAYARCSSFRKLVRAFGAITSAAGIAMPEWPPTGWLAS
jgi:hypothetical protein